MNIQKLKKEKPSKNYDFPKRILVMEPPILQHFNKAFQITPPVHPRSRQFFYKSCAAPYLSLKAHRKATQAGLGLRKRKGRQNARDAPQPSYGRENHSLGGTHHSMKRLAVLPRMENVGDEQGIRRDLIANFIVIHDEAPNLTG